MSIYITGDTHGTFDLRKVVYFFKGREEEFSRDDYLIICGDVGVCGFMASDEFKKTAAAKKNLCGCRSNWRLEAKKSPVVPGK